MKQTMPFILGIGTTGSYALCQLVLLAVSKQQMLIGLFLIVLTIGIMLISALISIGRLSYLLTAKRAYADEVRKYLSVSIPLALIGLVLEMVGGNDGVGHLVLYNLDRLLK